MHGFSHLCVLLHSVRVCACRPQVRGLLIALGRPDGRLYSQTRSEGWVLLGLLQAKVITSWGHQVRKWGRGQVAGQAEGGTRVPIMADRGAMWVRAKAAALSCALTRCVPLAPVHFFPSHSLRWCQLGTTPTSHPWWTRTCRGGRP